MQTDSSKPVDLMQLVADRYPQLTKSERRIADFIREHEHDAAFMSAAEIAASLGLSEPTLTRFARALGFENYPALREQFQANFRVLFTHSARIRSRLGELRADGDIYEQLVMSEINFLAGSLQSLDQSSFDQAVELLRTHQRIFVFGIGPAVSLVDLLEIRLTRFTRNVISLRTVGREIFDPLLLMSGEDLLIAIGFHSANPTLQFILDHANEKRTPVILITDTLESLLGNKATVTLSARRGPVSAFHSMTVPMTIINALLLALSAVDQEKIMANLDALDQMRDRIQHIEQVRHSPKRS